MTDQRKRRLKAKIQASRARLMETHPFFALLLMYLKFVAVNDIRRISTNGRCIYFAPNFVDKLYDQEMDYILCHQIMHIIHEHLWRPYDREDDDYHFACDILINNLLTKYGLAEEHYAHIGNIYKMIPGTEKSVDEMTTEEIYELLPFSLYSLDEQTRKKFVIDSDRCWNLKTDNSICGEIIIDIPESEGILRDKDEKLDSSCNVDAEFRQLWQIRVASTANSVVSSEVSSDGCDYVHNFVQRTIEKTHEPVIDWKKILDNFVQERICDYSFTPPDRRFCDIDFFLPDFNEKEFVTKEILFMVDTSGSVNDESLTTVYSEICGAIEQFRGHMIGKLGFFDVDVTPPLPFENISDLLNIIPYGGGGTDFSVIFNYIKNNYRDEFPACIIVFTDGDGPYPSQTESMGIPVLWIINNFDFTPPWGKIARIVPQNSML